MSAFLNATASVGVIVFLTATGYFAAARQWIDAGTKKFISKFLMNFAVPVMCVYGLTRRLTVSMIAGSLRNLAVPAINILLLYGLSFLTGKYLLRLPRRQMGVFMVMCSMSNAMFIGYGMCTELFGEAAIPYIMLFYIVSTSFTQLAGIQLIRVSGNAEPVPAAKQILKLLKTPPVLGIFISIFLVLADIQLPSIVYSYGNYITGLVTPLALILTGAVIREIGFKQLRFNRTITVVMIFRFILAPAICFPLCHLMGITGLARNVIVTEAAMPVITLTVVAATEYGADEKLAVQGTAISTLLSFLVIPLLILMF